MWYNFHCKTDKPSVDEINNFTFINVPVNKSFLILFSTFSWTPNITSNIYMYM